MLPAMSLSNMVVVRWLLDFVSARCVCTSELLSLHEVARQRDAWLRPAVRGMTILAE